MAKHRKHGLRGMPTLLQPPGGSLGVLQGPQETAAGSFLLDDQARSCDQSCQQKQESNRPPRASPLPHRTRHSGKIPVGTGCLQERPEARTTVLEPRSCPIPPPSPSHTASRPWPQWRPHAPSPELSPSRQDSPQWNMKGSDLATLSPPSQPSHLVFSRPLLCGQTVVANEPGRDRPAAHVGPGGAEISRPLHAIGITPRLI